MAAAVTIAWQVLPTGHWFIVLDQLEFHVLTEFEHDQGQPCVGNTHVRLHPVASLSIARQVCSIDGSKSVQYFGADHVDVETHRRVEVGHRPGDMINAEKMRLRR